MKQKLLTVGLAAAVLCVVCLGLEVGNNAGRNADLKAQVDALTEENTALNANMETLMQENEKQTQAWKDALEAANRYAQEKTKAVYWQEQAEKQVVKLEEELETVLEDWERKERSFRQANELAEESWKEAELELASLRQTSFSNETVRAVLDKYFDYQAVTQYGPVDLVVVAGLSDGLTGMEWVELKDEDVEDGVVSWPGWSYCATGVTEENFRNALFQTMSERCFELEFEGLIEVCDGYIYILDAGATGFGTEAISVERISGSLYRGVLEYHWISDEKTRSEWEFGVEEVNGNCVITAVKHIDD